MITSNSNLLKPDKDCLEVTGKSLTCSKCRNVAGPPGYTRIRNTAIVGNAGHKFIIYQGLAKKKNFPWGFFWDATQLGLRPLLVWFFALTSFTPHWPTENSTMNFSLFLIFASLEVFASFFMFSADVHSLQKRTKIPIPNSLGWTTLGSAIVPVIGHWDQSSVTRVESPVWTRQLL